MWLNWNAPIAGTPSADTELSHNGSYSINYLFCHNFFHITVAADREKKIMELQQTQKECIKQIKDLQHQLKVSHGQIREKDAVIAARQQEMQQLQQVTHEKDHDIEIREQQLQQRTFSW